MHDRRCARALDIVPADPGPLGRRGGPVRPGRRPEDVLVRVLAAPRQGLVVVDAREEPRSGLQRPRRRGRDPAPGLLAYRDGEATPSAGSASGRARTTSGSNGRAVRPRIDDLPVWSIVASSCSRASAAGPGAPAPRAADRLRRSTTARLRSRPTRSIRQAAGSPPASAYTGLLSTFEAAGFPGRPGRSTRRRRRSAG